MSIDNTEELVNTTHRWQHNCKAKAKDGRKCSLYSPHEGLHKPNNGLEKDRFGDDD